MAERVFAVDENFDMPASVRARQARHLGDTATPEGKALATKMDKNLREQGFVAKAVRTSVDKVKMTRNASYQTFITPYGGTNEVVHPSVYYNAAGWNGYPYWMAITPYQGGNNQVENPCIYASLDGDTWVVPAGGSNPVIPTPVEGYSSDNHLVMVGDVLYMFWRSVYASTEEIYYTTSKDGVSWTPRVTSLRSSHSVRRPVSPAILCEDGLWKMFAFDASSSPTKLLRFVSSSPVFNGVTPTVSTLTAVAGHEMWHLDVKRWGSELHMLVSDGTPNTNGMNGALWFAVSTDDGLTWTRRANPLIPRRDFAYPSWDRFMYRSSLVPSVVDGQEGYDVWYGVSAPEWRVGRGRISLSGHAETTVGMAHGAFNIANINLLSAFMGLAPYTVGDSFARPNNATTMGAADSGQAWVAGSGTWGIRGGKCALQATAVNSRAWIEGGLSDAVVDVEASGIVPSANQWWIMLRLTDAANYIRVGSPVAGSLLVQEIKAGAATQLASFGTRDPNSAWKVTLAGSAIKIHMNGELVGTTTATILSGTKYGLQVSDPTVEFDNFTVRSLVNGE